MNGISGILKEIVKRLRDPFLLAMLALVIVLAGAAAGELTTSNLIILSSVVVVLFVGYLVFHYRATAGFNERGLLILARGIIVAIKNEGYVPGNARQADLGAALIRQVVGTGDTELDRAGYVMGVEFKKSFGVPESYLDGTPFQKDA
jgi:hypothetical protein